MPNWLKKAGAVSDLVTVLVNHPQNTIFMLQLLVNCNACSHRPLRDCNAPQDAMIGYSVVGFVVAFVLIAVNTIPFAIAPMFAREADSTGRGRAASAASTSGISLPGA